ncbi:putative cytochrome P450 monooxygenase [Delphinella strobiligena]|nr:putative cytochrome P450 monooxygenase [Delphinella strobiligena]
MTNSKMSLPTAALVTGAGVASHLLYFKVGEHHLLGVRYIHAFLGVFALAVLATTHVRQIPFGLALASTTNYAVLYLVGLYTSLLVWRAFFSPLNKFPGPYAARITKFHQCYTVRKFDRHHILRKLHHQYGNFVRVGPNEISVADPLGVVVTTGPQSKCIKSPWYDADHPRVSLHTSRDPAEHARRRRIWSPAFSDKAIRGYEMRVGQYNDAFVKEIEARSGQALDASQWFSLYGFDVMGDLAFGKGFGSIKSGKMHWAIELLNEGMKFAGLAFPEWFFRVLAAIPGAAKDFHRFNAFCDQRVEGRISMQGNSDHPDITHFLIEDYNKRLSDKKQSDKSALPNLQADSKLIIVAGSDTSSATFAFMFFYLATHPDIQEKLRQEVEGICGGGDITNLSLKDAPWLNGSINEALRLNPPVPSGVSRKTPKEGVYVGETYIPGETAITVPQFVLGHGTFSSLHACLRALIMYQDESIYARPEDFLPQRWSSQPELIKNKEAFAPFSTGPYNCIGKNLALTELRTLTAHLIRRFHVALAPGEDGSALLTKSEDHFVTGLAPVNLVFTRRA